MRILTGIVLAGGLLMAAPFGAAQEPGDGPRRPPGGAEGGDLVSRMMKFDKNGDGTLSRAEVTDQRLRRLFDRADTNKNRVVTKEELSALADRERDNERGGPGGPGGFGPGGPMMAPPRPGEILPGMLRDRLQLSDEQKAQLDALQKDVDARLETILTDEQKSELKAMRQRGPGGFGPPGGRGRPGGPPPPPNDRSSRSSTE